MLGNLARPLVAVIDIGSNSVRLVVYDRLRRVPRPLFNEKSTCGLGQGVQTTGRLDPKAKECAVLAMRRFIFLVRAMGAGELHVIATAAMREAQDGSAFVRALEHEHGISIRVISGEEEAYLAGQAIVSSIHRPQGIAGDMGGGSFEVIDLSAGAPGTQATFTLGSLALLGRFGEDAVSMQAHIASELASLPWFCVAGGSFYAIGGGFRNLARVHMKETDYPLPILHQYAVPAEQMIGFCQKVLSLSSKERGKLKGMGDKRQEILVPSAALLSEALRLSETRQVVFSAAGIREGLLYDLLPSPEHDRDALFASVAALHAKEQRDEAYAVRLEAWQSPLFAQEPEEWRRLRGASCRLTDMALAVSPDFRAEWAFEHVLVAALYGISHEERIMLALAMYYRHRERSKLRSEAIQLLSAKAKAWALVIGMSAHIAFEISAGTPQMLERVRLCVEGSTLRLIGDAQALMMVPPTLAKRLEGLSQALKVFIDSRT